MPEGLEAEIWTRGARPLVGRTIRSVWCDERVAPSGLAELLVGTVIETVRRRGKILLVETTGPTLGLHFGMTGRLEIDGRAPIERLEYASGADRPQWDRLRIGTEPAGGDDPALRMNDPRRLGRISIDPDLSELGPDLLAVSPQELVDRLARRRSAVKSALLDQRVVAGLGNLCVDEVLFWAGIAPTRPVDSLAENDISAISAACRKRLPVMLAAGGSTHGDISPDVRAAGGPCPVDGGALQRTRINGRTTVWCGDHQR